MTESSLQSDSPFEEPNMKKTHKRMCDYCGDSTALLYCRADSAKLCFSCDGEVHSTNPLFSKHNRSILCDACDSSPSSIFCETEQSVFCQDCDWERHSSEIHSRRPIEGFTGCPCVSEMLMTVGFEDLGKKGLLLSGQCCDDDDVVGRDGFGGGDEFEDLFVWDTPAVGSFDDLIFSSDKTHGFQALGVPPLPKNRNAACGKHKDEILSQLRELAKLEPNLNNDIVDAEANLGNPSLVPELNLQPGNIFTGYDYGAEPIPFSASEQGTFHRCNETDDSTSKSFLPSAFLKSHNEESSVVPEKYIDITGSVSNTKNCHEGPSQNPVDSETLSVVPKFAPKELTSQERDSAISRYKEKKKTRRYDGHIRYESRKIRAESRTRLRGRFAKMER